MRVLVAITALSLLAAAPAAADTRIFIVENQRDGYGVDQCLASGAHCGTPVANAYCQSRQYDHAVSFRRLEPAEVTGGESGNGGSSTEASCHGGLCSDHVAIECAR